jgi:hypothetical protein
MQSLCALLSDTASADSSIMRGHIKRVHSVMSGTMSFVVHGTQRTLQSSSSQCTQNIRECL